MSSSEKRVIDNSMIALSEVVRTNIAPAIGELREQISEINNVLNFNRKLGFAQVSQQSKSSTGVISFVTVDELPLIAHITVTGAATETDDSFLDLTLPLNIFELNDETSETTELVLTTITQVVIRNESLTHDLIVNMKDSAQPDSNNVVYIVDNDDTITTEVIPKALGELETVYKALFIKMMFKPFVVWEASGVFPNPLLG